MPCLRDLRNASVALFVVGVQILPTAQAQYVQQGPKLVGTSSTGDFGSQQGWRVALSADGNTAITGGPGDNGEIGAAWVFTRSGGVWAQQGSKLHGTDAVGKSVAEGSDVALSADGNTAIVGGNLDNGGVGAAWVYTRDDGVWTQQGPKLVGTGGSWPRAARRMRRVVWRWEYRSCEWAL